MKKVLLLSAFIFAFIAYANNNTNEESSMETAATSVRIDFHGTNCMFDCIIGDSIQTVVHNRPYYDNVTTIYHNVSSATPIVLKNFRTLAGEPRSQVSISGNYGCYNQKSIPGGFQFTLIPNAIQNGVFINSISR